MRDQFVVYPLLFGIKIREHLIEPGILWVLEADLAPMKHCGVIAPT